MSTPFAVATDELSSQLMEIATPDDGNSGLSAGLTRAISTPRMAPSPKEEGMARRKGTFDLLDVLLVPKDPRGIVLACGLVALAALGAYTLLVGDLIGIAYLVSAVFGYLFLQTRLVPAAVWLFVALGGLAGAAAGNPSAWIVVGLGAILFVVSIVRPAESHPLATSRGPEVRGGGAQLQIASTTPVDRESSRNLEVGGAGANGTSPSPRDGRLIEPDVIDEASPASPVVAKRVFIRSIGSLRLDVDGQDRTERLREQPRLEFLLSYLLARKVLAWDESADRSLLALEIAPGYDASTQLDRLRKTLHAFQNSLGPDLKRLVRVTSKLVRLDLDEATLDAFELYRLSTQVLRRQGLVDGALAEEIREQLEATAGGEFLAGFSELEHHVTEGRGTAGSAVEAARLRLAGWRADLTAALARYLEAAGRPNASIAYLRSALDQIDREDLARLLVAAYLQTGQTARADEIRAEYKLG